MDQRLVVAFPPEGAVIADLSVRRTKIQAWYRGMGQINRTQGVWDPDWVGIDFIVRPPPVLCFLASLGLLFEIILP